MPVVILYSIFCCFRMFISTLDKAWEVWKNGKLPSWWTINFFDFSVAVFLAYFERMGKR